MWTIVRGTYDYFGVLQENRNRCGDAEYGQPRTIRVYQDAPTDVCGTSGKYLHKILMHEMGHTIGLHHITRVASDDSRYANAEACRATNAMMTDTPLNVRELSEEVDCKFAHKYLRDDHPVDCAETPEHEDCTDDGGDGGGGGGGDPEVDCAAGDCRPGDHDGERNECGLQPTPECPGYCELNPFHRDCPPDCSLFPTDPRCGDITYQVCWGRFEDTDGDGELDCVPGENLRVGGDGRDPVVVTASSVSSRDYRIHMDHGGTLGVDLSGMSRNFDCEVSESGDSPNKEGPQAAAGATPTWSCTNLGGTLGDSLERRLPAGTHTLTVYPLVEGTGDYTLALTYVADPLPGPVAMILPFTSEVTTASSSTFRFSLAEQTDVTVLISGLSADFDCRVGSLMECSNNRGTLDDAWSGTLGASTQSLTVYPHDGASGSFKLAVYRTGETPPSHDAEETVDEDEGEDETGLPTPVPEGPPPTPPEAVSLGGSVVGLAHALEWAEPVTAAPITKYRVEIRNFGTAAWYTTTLGSPSPSADLPAATRSWTIATTGGDARDYRVRAESSAGEGVWSNVVRLRTESAAPPPPPPQPSAAPVITGSVVRQTQTVSWNVPASATLIVRYQLQTRNSSQHLWRFTTAGYPTPSASLPPATSSWSVTTPANLYRQYRVRATNAGGDSAWSNVVALQSGGSPAPAPEPPPPPPPASPPGAPTLSGSLASVQTHSLSWSTAASTIPLTGHQMQTRNSTRHGWRYTSAGSPSPSHGFGADVRGWSVTTSAGLHRQYRVRAGNASGYGAWSNVVSLTSGGGGGAAGVGGVENDDDGDGDPDDCGPEDPDC